jgi:hypothetical protein
MLPAIRVPGLLPGPGVQFVFTMVPLTNGVTATPPIPFSYFDPHKRVYVDLTIPPVPLEVLPGGDETRPQDTADDPVARTVERKDPALSALAAAPGRAGSVDTIQRKAWFVVVQAIPVAGLIAAWAWERRRRYFEQHPDIVRRRRARRELRRERRTIERAHRSADPAAYGAAAVRAMRVACAPHFPADPEALVCRDVIETLEHAGSSDHATVRRFFEAVDANEFAGGVRDGHDLLSKQEELDSVLRRLEARL